MELYIYDKALELIGLVEIFDSLRWRRRYFTAGEFELHLRANSENVALLNCGHIVWRRDAKETGIIESVSIDGEELTIKGRFLSSLLNSRIVWQKTQLNTTGEIAMRTLVSEMTPIPNLELGILKEYPQTVDLQVTYKNIASTLTKIARVTGIGYLIKFDNAQKKLLFECFKGEDRSALQSINAKVVFSEAYENIHTSHYELSTENLKTVVLVAGEGEGDARVLVTVGDATGFERKEVFVDAKDIRMEGLTAEAYEALLVQRGQEVLAKSFISESLESTVNFDSNLVYKKDFDLGDIVTCLMKSWNKRVDVRITEIEEVYENGVVAITPTFGSPLPELKDILKEE